MNLILFLLLRYVSSECMVPSSPDHTKDTNKSRELPPERREFPPYPTDFRAQIRVTTYRPTNPIEETILDKIYISTIDQVYKKTSRGVQGSVIFRDAVLGYAGFIYEVYDTEPSHELYFTDTGCISKSTENSSHAYEPFHFGLDSHNNETWGFHDIWKLFQDREMYAYVGDDDCGEMRCEKFVGCAGPNISVTAYSNYDKSLISVEIVADTLGLTTRRVFDYRSALRSAVVTDEDFIPPTGVFCSSNLEIDLPKLESFYKMDFLVLLEGGNTSYYNKIITFSEYKYEGLIAVRYHTGTDQTHKRIVHDRRTDKGWIISEKQGLCLSYSADIESFKWNILALTDIVENNKKFVLPIWEVLETLKYGKSSGNGKTSGNKIAYRGTMTKYGIQTDVWEIGLKDYLIEIAFTKKDQILPKGSMVLMRKLPLSLKIYDVDEDDTPRAARAVLDVIEYSVQDNNVIVNNLFDISECFTTNATVLVQFRLDIAYDRVHQFGIGNFIQGVTKSVISSTMAGHYQFSHMSIGPVGRKESIVIFTLSQTEESGSLPIHVVLSRLEVAIDGQKMFITVVDYERKHVQAVLPIAQSLIIFDSTKPYQHPWQVSVSATISACLGTSFIGLLLGALINHWWSRRKNKYTPELRSPTYTQFENEEEGGADL